MVGATGDELIHQRQLIEVERACRYGSRAASEKYPYPSHVAMEGKDDSSISCSPV